MKILFLMMFLFNLSLTFAQDATKPAYMNFLYKVEDGDTFASILRQYVNDDAVIVKTTPLVQKNLSFNPHITDWTQLIPGSLISVYIPEDMMDMTKYNSKQSVIVKKTQKVENNIIAKTGAPVGFKASLFYMASWGDFSQSSNGTSVEYKQNSLVTLGVQGNYFPKNSLYSFSASTYFSTFSAAETTISPYSVQLPAEIGFNAYGDYLWKKARISFHGGLDYEKFSAFNIEGIFNDQIVYLNRLSVVYLTFGVSHVFNILEKPIFVKASYSQSVSSTSTNDYPNSTITESLSGSKMLFYVNYKFTDKFFLHTLLKIHSMTGPSELSSTRLGVGVGYLLF